MRPLEKRLMLDASITAIGGNVLWLDGADQSTILDADGDDANSGGAFSGSVATWQDKSGNNNDLSHGTPARQPTYNAGAKNGNGTITFDGGDALFATDASIPSLDLSTNGFTLFAIVDTATSAGNRIIINKESSYEIGVNAGQIQAAINTVAGGNWAWGGTANNALSTTWHIVGFEHANTTWRFHQDGNVTEEIVPANNQTGNITPTNDIFTVGARGAASPNGSWFLGDMAEVILFNRELTSDEYHDVENYLANKWGIATTNATPTEVTSNTAYFSNAGTITLDTSLLSYTDIDNTDSLLSYEVTTLAGPGILKLNGTAMNVNETFTQQDLISGNVTYDHLTSVTSADSFQFTVTDRLVTTAIQTFNIDMAATETANNPVTLDEGAVTDITNADLAHTDNVSLGFREQLTISSSLTNSNLTDFTLLLTEANISANFWANVRADGSDIYVTLADGVTKLNRELVTFNKVGQTMELHVKIPTISSTVDTDLYLYFGGLTSESNNAGTWDANTQMVQHFEETAGTATDSTVNGLDGTVTAGSYGAAGQIGDGVSFQAGRSLTVNQALDTSNTFTIDFWADYTATGTWQTTFFQNVGAAWNELLTVNAATEQFTIWTKTGGAGVALGMQADYVGWHKYTFAYDGTNLDMYKDGGLVNSIVYNWSSAPTGFQAGQRTDSNQPTNAFFDEYTFDTTERSADWIAAEYAMQNTPAAFYSLGVTEALPTTLTYTLTDLPDNGDVTLNGAVLGLGATFTQGDIDGGLIKYQHNDSDTTMDSFDFLLSSSTGNALPADRTFTLNINAINDAPINNPAEDSSGDSNNRPSQANDDERSDSGRNSDNGIASTGEIIRSILNGSGQSSFYGDSLSEIMRNNNTLEVSRIVESIDNSHDERDDKVTNVIERGLNDDNQNDDPAWWKILDGIIPEDNESAPDLDEEIAAVTQQFDASVQEFMEALE
ncbi:MAG: hypothetical protein DHS20C02_18920 [Micavibrio sp.]|nr:MAG: hypothetical protein DHS20C02_18920 [Micavibrio sp.]